MVQEAPEHAKPGGGPAFLSYGFRPFFLGAGIYGMVGMAGWLAAFAGGFDFPWTPAPPAWHAHELLAGYAFAVLAGFLLTASPSWSNRPPVTGAALGALTLLWLAARLFAWFGGGVPLLAAFVDLAFLPALALTVLPALRAGARHNFIFLPLLGLLFTADLLIHLEEVGQTGDTATAGIFLLVDGLILLIAMIGGRVTPAFTASALKARGIEGAVRRYPKLDALALSAIILLIVADLVAPAQVVGWVALAAAALHAARLAGWGTRHTLGDPILWVLHLGYGWLVVGLAWRGLMLVTDIAADFDAVHGLTVGAVGTMTLAVMSRAALGHTGRPLKAPGAIILAYVLVSAAAILRLASPFLPGEGYLHGLMGSGVLWALAFALFAAIFAPMLLAPRADQSE